MTIHELISTDLREPRSTSAELSAVDLLEAELAEAEAEVTGAELIGAELIGTELLRAELLRGALIGAEAAAADAPVDASVSAKPVAAPSRRLGALLRAVGTGLSAGLLALVLALATAVIIVPHMTHSTTLTVLTGSMEPKLPPGTLLVVRHEPIDSIRLGQVVTYEPNPHDAATVISHRVIGISTATNGTRVFTVKGDANNTPDAPVQSKQIVAVLWYSVPLMGWVNAWVGGAGRGWLIPVAACLLFAYAAYSFITGAVEQHRRARERGRRGEGAHAA